MSGRQGTDIQAILFDLDGVLYVGNKPIAGAAEVVGRLIDYGHRIAGLTNTTTQPRRVIAEKLASMGIPIAVDSIHTPAALACRAIGSGSARLYIQPSLAEDFSDIRLDESDPDYIVMGDVGGEGYPPETLREIFQHVMDGARVLALHKNRFWQKADGLHLDLGTFVAAIEYATGQPATVLGKPSRHFFFGVCQSLGVLPERAVMIGDDIDSDIGGAQKAGLKTVLVETGKYRAEFVKQTGIRADLLIPSVADLPEALSLL